MLQSIEGYYITVTTPSFMALSFTYPGSGGPLPPGRTVFEYRALVLRASRY